MFFFAKQGGMHLRTECGTPKKLIAISTKLSIIKQKKVTYRKSKETANTGQYKRLIGITILEQYCYYYYFIIFYHNHNLYDYVILLSHEEVLSFLGKTLDNTKTNIILTYFSKVF